MSQPSIYGAWGSVNDNCGVPEQYPRTVVQNARYYVDPNRSRTGDGSGSVPLNWAQFLLYVSLPRTLPGHTFVIKAGSYGLTSLTGAGSDAFVTILASGTALQPLQIVGETVAGTRADGSSGDVPATFFLGLVGGTVTNASAPTGFRFESCEYVLVENIGVIACGNGIEIRGACRYLRFDNMRVAWNAVRGIWLSATDGTAGTTHGCGSSEIDGDYPACVVIERSELNDNGCGCDSAGTQVMIGVCATNVTVRCCDIFCTSELRGSDGITFAASSSGHVIERNRIHDIPRLRYEDCPADCPPEPDRQDRSDGDGIDLKGVMPRTSESGEYTVIRHNAIFRCSGTGITIQAGSLQVHVYENEIFCVNTGILLKAGAVQSDPENLSSATDYVEVRELHIYRNLVYCTEVVDEKGGNAIEVDLEGGIKRHGDDESVPRGFSIRMKGITIAHNTIDRAARKALTVHRNDDAELLDGDVTFELDSIRVINNIFSRSERANTQRMQMVRHIELGQYFEFEQNEDFEFDGNLYVFEVGELAASGFGTPRNARIVRPAGEERPYISIWEMWNDSNYAFGWESSWQGRGDNPLDQNEASPLNPAEDLATVTDVSTYELVAGSPALGTAVTPTGIDHWEGNAVVSDLSLTLDFYQKVQSGWPPAFTDPDVGAVESDEEVPPENELSSTLFFLRPSRQQAIPRLQAGRHSKRWELLTARTEAS